MRGISNSKKLTCVPFSYENINNQILFLFGDRGVIITQKVVIIQDKEMNVREYNIKVIGH